ncbi:MAG: YceI family protein [Candidatus Kapabacteria bacterium]|jgi:polyisoprenoid-binding protein YceI|nr:YceI family protein [Candidatus Kapabacteria bacterium]
MKQLNFLFVSAAFALVAFAQSAFAPSIFAQSSWTLDKSHSSVKFGVQHLVVSEVEGSFKSFTGTVNAKDDQFTDAKIDFAVDIASINTDDEKRDGHLKSDDFFNAEKFPQMKFVGKTFKKTGKNKYKLTGDLTIRDVTKTVSFDVDFGGIVKDPWGNTKAGFKAVTSINRFDYNLKWNTMLEAGGAVVGKDVKITVNIELAKAKA